MKFAYADPPYPGMAQRHYAHEAAADGRIAREVNHALLVAHLCDEYPDGWALSTSSPALQFVLSLCPEDVRVGAWVKPFAVFRPNVNPAYAWEPVVFRGGRQPRSRDELTVRDWVSANITMQKGVPGAKPAEFVGWVVDMLGAQMVTASTTCSPVPADAGVCSPHAPKDGTSPSQTRSLPECADGAANQGDLFGA